MHRFGLPALALILAVAPEAPADWEQFRGPTGQGHAAGSNLPTEWGPKQNITWRKELPGNGWSSPVVVAGKIYLTTAVPQGKDYSLRALRIDAATAKIEWDREVFVQHGDQAPRIHSKNSHASPTPVVVDGRVYLHFGHLGTACLDTKDGTKIWGNQSLRYNPVHGNGGSPIVADDNLVFSIDGTDQQAVVALDKKSGKIAWQTPRNTKAVKKFSFSTPLVIDVAGTQQIISAGSDVVLGLDAKSGREIWRVRYSGYSLVPRPIFGNGLLFVCTGYDSPGLYAIRPDGKGDVTDTHVAWTVKKAAMPRNASPLLVGDALYTVSDSGILTCIDAKTGKERWNENLGRPHSASPIFAGRHIYLLAEDGTATVFKPGPSYDPVATIKMGERALASYAADGNALFLRTEKALYRIEKK